MDQEDWTETLQLPKPDWACKHEKPANMEPYAGRRIYAEAKPDRLGLGEGFQIPGLSRAFQGFPGLTDIMSGYQTSWLCGIQPVV